MTRKNGSFSRNFDNGIINQQDIKLSMGLILLFVNQFIRNQFPGQHETDLADVLNINQNVFPVIEAAITNVFTVWRVVVSFLHFTMSFTIFD